MISRTLLTTLVVVCFAAPAPAEGLVGAFRPIVADANTATVRVLSDGKDAALGTVVADDGYILTKASELRGDLTVKLGDGSVLTAELFAHHKATDLALLKIEMKGLVPVTFANTNRAERGHWLAAAGVRSDPTAVGIVSVMTRKLTGLDATDILNNNRGFIGVELEFSDDADGGATIRRLSDDGAAKKAGLKPKDVVFELDGYEVKGRVALQEMLDNYRPDDTVKLKVRRGDDVLDIKVTLTKRPGPKGRSEIQNAMGGKLSGRRTGFPSVLQTDMVVDPEDCGGPIVDLDGKVLGISIARAGRVETWVLPSETIRPILTDMKAGKYPPPGRKVPRLVGADE